MLILFALRRLQKFSVLIHASQALKTQLHDQDRQIERLIALMAKTGFVAPMPGKLDG